MRSCRSALTTRQADSAEKLYAHLWGCVDLDPSENPEIMHLGGNSGSAWTAVSSDQDGGL